MFYIGHEESTRDEELRLFCEVVMPLVRAGCG